MKKILKYSLIATIALAGNSLSAKDLSEAIKNVDVSGVAAYRYNDYAAGVHTNQYKLNLNVSSKITDDIKLNTRIKSSIATLDTTDTGDGNFDIGLSEVNFVYTGVENLSVTMGKQAIVSPWTVMLEDLGNENNGTGIYATYNLGFASLVGGFFNQTNLGASIHGEVDETSEVAVAHQDAADAIGASDVYLAGLLTNVGPLSLDAYYMNMEDQFDTYTFGANAAFEIGALKLSPFARYTSLTAEKNSEFATRIGQIQGGAVQVDEEQELYQVGINANIGRYYAFAAFGESGDNGGVIYLDTYSKTNMDYQWRVTADGSANTKYTYLNGRVALTEKIIAGLFYSEADYETKDDVSEVYAQVAFKISKNLFAYARYGQLDKEGVDEDNMGRLHVRYSF